MAGKISAGMRTLLAACLEWLTYGKERQTNSSLFEKTLSFAKGKNFVMWKEQKWAYTMMVECK